MRAGPDRSLRIVLGPPGGALGWTARFAARSLWILAIAIAVLWAIGAILNDRWHWSQYLWWIPSLVAGAAGSACALGGWIIWIVQRWLIGPVPSAGVARGRTAKLGLAALATIVPTWIAFAAMDLAWTGRTIDSGALDSRSPGSIRLLSLNAMGTTEIDPLAWAASLDPDLAMLANTRRVTEARAVESLSRTSLARAHTTRQMRFFIVSRWPIIDQGFLSLRLGGEAVLRNIQDPEQFRDPGLAGYVVIEPPGTDPVVVWMIDLPSDLSRHRAEFTRLARERIGEYQRSDGRTGFPEPDAIMGDFNIPRGSASTELLTGPNARSAFAMGGRGYGASWPRATPLWHIDQILVDPRRWAVEAHALPDPGAGSHRAVVADLTKR